VVEWSSDVKTSPDDSTALKTLFVSASWRGLTETRLNVDKAMILELTP